MTKNQLRIEQETIEEANYLIENNTTIRNTAKHFGVSKSAVHNRLSKYLKDISFNLFNDVQKILNQNKEERHIRGGMATKQKYITVN